MSKCLVAMQRGIIWAATVIPEPPAPTKEHLEYYKDAARMRRDAAKIPDGEVKEMETEQVRQTRWGKPLKRFPPIGFKQGKLEEVEDGRAKIQEG